MGAHFPVDFRLNSRDIDELYVRVTPCFSSLQHSQELVYRCVQHEQAQFNRGRVKQSNTFYYEGLLILFQMFLVMCVSTYSDVLLRTKYIIWGIVKVTKDFLYYSHFHILRLELML